MNISSYSGVFEKILKMSFLTFGERDNLREACEYALGGSGKRLRPVIVMAIADRLGFGLDVSDAALAIEYFHTSSLIADDLPCMDDDDMRRGKPSLHKVYGETTALLASYGLISEAFQKIYDATVTMRKAPERFSQRADQVGMIALDIAAKGSGFHGATGGQFMDMFPPGKDIRSIEKVIEKKTMKLFEVAFSFGWLFGGGEIEALKRISQMAYHFGFAYQIADDLSDYEKDQMQRAEMNLAILYGTQSANELMHKHLSSFEILLKELRLNSPVFEELVEAVLVYASTFSSTKVS